MGFNENDDRCKDYHKVGVDLLPSFWNKNKDQAWRMNIDIDIMMANYDDSNTEIDTEARYNSGDDG